MFGNDSGGAGQQDDGSTKFGWGGLGASLRKNLQEQTQDLASKVAAVASQAQVGLTEERENVLKSSFWQEPNGDAGNSTGLQQQQQNQQQQRESNTTASPGIGPTVVSLPPPGTPLFPPSKPPPTSSNTPKVETITPTPAPEIKAKPLSSRNPDDISKDELLEILSKMNRRVKQLTSIKTQLTERVGELEIESSSVKNLIREEILSEIDIEDTKIGYPEEEDEVVIYRKAWRVADERNSLMLQQLQNEYKVMTLKKGAELEKIENQYKDQMERLLQQHSSENSSEDVLILNQKLDEQEKTIEMNKEEAKKECQSKLKSQKCTLEENFQADLKLFIAEAVATHKTQWEADKEALESKHDIELEETNTNMTAKQTKIQELEKKLLDQEKGFKEEIDKKAKDELRMNMELNQSIHELQNYKETQHVQHEKGMKAKLQHWDQLQKKKMEMLQQKHLEDVQLKLNSHGEMLADKHEKELAELKFDGGKMDILQKQMEGSNTELDEWKQKNKLYVEEITSLKEFLKNNQSEKEGLESTHTKQIQESQVQLQELKNTIQHEYQTKTQTMEQEHEKLQKLQVDSVGKIEQLQKEVESSKVELQDWKKKNQLDEEKVAKLKESLNNIQLEKEELESTHVKKIHQTQTQLQESTNKLQQEYQSKIQTITTEHQQQTQEVQNSALQIKSTLEEQITTLQTQLKTLQSEHDKKLNAQKEKAKSLRQKQKTDLEEKHSTETQTIQSSYEIKISQIQKEEEVQRCQQLEQQKQEFDMKMDLLQNEFSSTKAQLERVASSKEGEEGKQMEEALSKQKLSYEQYMKSQEERLMSQIEDSRQKHELAVSSMEDMEKNNKSVVEELSSKKTEYQTKVEECQELAKEKEAELDTAQKKLQLQNDTTKETIAKKDEERISLQESIQNLQKQLHGVNEEKKKINKSLEEIQLRLETDTQQFQDRIHSMESNQSQIMEEVQKEKKLEVDTMQKKMQMENDEMIQSVDRSEQERSSMQESMHALKNQLDDVIEKKSRTAQESQEVKLSLESDVCQLQETVENLKSNHTQQMEELQSTQKSQSRNMLDLQEALSSKNEDMDKLKFSLDSASKEKNEVKERYDDLKTQNATLISKAEELQSNAKNIASNMEDEKQMEVKKLQEEIQGLQTTHKTEIESLKDDWKSDVSQKVTEAKDIVSKELKEKFEKQHSKSLAEISSKQEESERESKFNSESQLHDLKSEAEVARKERGTLQSQILTLQEQLEQEREKLITNFRKKLLEFKGESSKAMSMKDQEKVEALKQVESKFRSKEKELIGQCDMLKEKVMVLQKEKEESMETMDMLHATCQSLEEKNRSTVESMGREYKEVMTKVKNESDFVLQKLKSDHENKFQSLKMDHKNILNSEKKNLSRVLEESFNAELQSKIEQHSQALKEAEQDKAQHVAKARSFFETKAKELQTDHTKILDQLKAEILLKDQKVTRLETELISSRSLYSSAVREKEAILMQMQTLRSTEQSLRKHNSSMKKELDEAISNSSATASSLLEEQEKLRLDNGALAEKLTTLKSEYHNSRNEVEELGGKLKALTDNLNCLLVDKKENDQKLVVAQKQEEKLKATEGDLSSLREDVSKLKLEQTKNAGIVARLQAEKDNNERKHGQRTALVGMLEAQLAELNDAHDDANSKLEAALYDLSERDDNIASLKDQSERTESQLKQLQQKKRELVYTNNSAAAPSQQTTINNSDADAKKSKMVDALQKEVMSLQQQMARKSAAAQRLIQEREAECMQLRKTNQHLQKEVNVGSLSDKRILELAAQQSNRDSKAIGEVEVRDKIVKRLTSTLVSRDSDLADVEYDYQQVSSYMEELSRVSRREDVNLDYLKSIIVQYLSKPPGSSERASLLPVIATLLQFDGMDYKAIEAGAQKVSWWGQIVPTVINAPTDNETLSLNGFGLATPGASDLSNNNPYYKQEAASLIPSSISNTDPSSIGI